MDQRANMDPEEDSRLRNKIKEWMSDLGDAFKSRISLMDPDPRESNYSLQLAIYPQESLFSFLPTFHVFLDQSEYHVNLRLLSYNETILAHESFPKDNLSLKASKILRLISDSPILRLCSGLVSNEAGSEEDVILESLSSKRVSRSSHCAYILTKERDLCCRECLSSSDHLLMDYKGSPPHINGGIREEVESLSESFPEEDSRSVHSDDSQDPNLDPLFCMPSSGEEDALEDEEESYVHIPTTCKSKVRKKSSRKSDTKTFMQCEICFSTFSNKGNLEAHLASHESLKNTLTEPCVCPLCSQDISSRQELNNHIRLAHPEKEDLLCCFICYKFIKSLANHLNGAHDTRTVICSKCGKTVKHRYYNEHLTHTHGAKKDRRVICPVCGKIICRMSNLSLHMKVMHSDESEKVLACEVCGKTFSHMKVLKKHFEVHQARKYKCKLCEYKTYRKSNVAIHLKKSHHMADNVYSFVEDLSAPIQVPGP